MSINSRYPVFDGVSFIMTVYYILPQLAALYPR